MEHTKLDEIMLEMIKPKMDEISAKFTNKQPLDQEDINTLLIKAQFNHIEHLDTKLDIVTDSVVALEGKFFSLENNVNTKISALEGKFFQLENNFLKLENSVNSKISALENKVDTKISGLENKVDTKISGLEKKIDGLGTEMKIAIKEGIITNMKFTLGTIGLIAAIFKILDIYKI